MNTDTKPQATDHSVNQAESVGKITDAAVGRSGSMSAQHTPGPWWFDVHTNVVAAGGLVAFPGIAAGFDQAANARLIAAAPELLALLVESQWSIGGDWRARRDAAISKATGRSA